MIGGIYCVMDVGDNKTITQELLGKEIPIKIKRIDDALNKIIGTVSNLSKLAFQDYQIQDYLLNIAYSAMSRRMSARHRRDFLNDTVDLMHSMGVWVQKGYGKEENVDGKDYRPFGGGSSENPTSRNHSGEDMNPDERFKKSIYGTVGKIVGTPNIQNWYIVFAATMPYAVRLEHKPVNGMSGGYGKRVMIGQFHTLMNQFVRDSGMGLSGSGGVKIQKYYYGYIFESTNASQIVEAG